MEAPWRVSDARTRVVYSARSAFVLSKGPILLLPARLTVGGRGFICLPDIQNAERVLAGKRTRLQIASRTPGCLPPSQPANHTFDQSSSSDESG